MTHIFIVYAPNIEQFIAYKDGLVICTEVNNYMAIDVDNNVHIYQQKPPHKRNFVTKIMHEFLYRLLTLQNKHINITRHAKDIFIISCELQYFHVTQPQPLPLISCNKHPSSNMTLDQLVMLYILQKNYLTDKTQVHHKQAFFEMHDELLYSANVSRENVMAPPLFAMQMDIPFVLLMPTALTQNTSTPLPLSIHVHGGPQVYIEPNIRHAEIAYLLSNGYIVVCVNYRGSTGYPEIGTQKNEWQALSGSPQYAKERLIYAQTGPEDVYAVAKYMIATGIIDKNKIFLRGGSFGSHINAHILDILSNTDNPRYGQFDNIFAGIHLSGGWHYPRIVSDKLTKRMPILITHGVQDEISIYQNEKHYIKEALLKYNTYVFIAYNGDHHLIDPTLQVHDKTVSYAELKHYLTAAVAFMFYLSLPTKTKQLALDPYKERMLLQMQEIDDSLTYKHSPTKAMLAICLKEEYTGITRIDVKNFLHKFDPFDYTNDDEYFRQLHAAGHHIGDFIAQDGAFVKQLLKMIAYEEKILKQHPEWMVLYHAATPDIIFLYCFIDSWKSRLAGVRSNPEHIYHMRFCDFITNSFLNIQSFLDRMHLEPEPAGKWFNNIYGFSERAFACNPTLISNAHSLSSCSLWWFYAQDFTRSKTLDPVSKIKTYIDLLGLTEQTQNYVDLLADWLADTANQSNTLMQQLFIDKDIAEQYAYLCQIWGKEITGTGAALEIKTSITQLVTDPLGFEQKLRERQQQGTCVFVDYEIEDNRIEFWQGHICRRSFPSQGLANLLQIRCLANAPIQHIHSYFRRPEKYNQLYHRLAGLIDHDIEMLQQKTTSIHITISPSMVAASLHGDDCLEVTRRGAPLATFILQQEALFLNYDENPVIEKYQDIRFLSYDQKHEIQKYLWSTHTTNAKGNGLYLFATCKYLIGYTYYDLLYESVMQYIDTINCLPEYKQRELYCFFKNEHEAEQASMSQADCRKKVTEIIKNEFMHIMTSFCDPQSQAQTTYYSYMDSKKLSSTVAYERFNTRLKPPKFDGSKHQFHQPDPDPKKQYYDTYLFDLEVGSAMETVLSNLRKAKKKVYNFPG